MKIKGNRIHFNTIQKVYRDKFGCEIEDKSFPNQLTGEVHNLIFEKGTDVALLSKKQEGEYVCLDTYGEPVDRTKIVAYTDLVYVEFENGLPVYEQEHLELYHKGERIDLSELAEREKLLYPERTGITFEADYRYDGFTQKKVMCCVDEIVYVNDQEFSKIIHGDNSQILTDYNERTYTAVPEGCEHGILVLALDGRGIFVSTEGYDYARHYAFDMKLGEKLQPQIDMEMKNKAVHEIRLYAPVTVIESEDGINESIIDGREYFDHIKEAVDKTNERENERCLANYLKKENLKTKVYSITPDLTVKNEKMMAVAVIRLTKPLEYYELDELKDFCAGQFSDGWGESSHFDGIRTDGTHLFVHFTDETKETVMTEEEAISFSEEQYIQNTQEHGEMQLS